MNTYREQELENKAKEKINEYSAAATSAIQESEEKAKDRVAELEKKFRQGQEQVRQAVSNVDKQLHQNPWPIVSAVAIGAIFFGFLLGRRND
jgi:ElaB/YqjD/DUF883 family membrane-anchored ribosome-binding protein